MLAKSASGALELVPLVTVQNLARALTELNEQRLSDRRARQPGRRRSRGGRRLRAPLALVLGAEGKGLRQLHARDLRSVARLDMPGEIKSLNVSNAACCALYRQPGPSRRSEKARARRGPSLILFRSDRASGSG